MIYIAVALGIEAKPIIKFFNLKRDNEIKKVQVFKNERITLIITGVGILKSAITLTYILSKLDIHEDDMFLNLGICGAKNKDFTLGDIVLCNKVISSEIKKSYYPDMLFVHPFKEGSLESFNTPIYSGEGVLGDLVDMEGAGLIEASTYFFQSYQLNFIKIVSDHLNMGISSEEVEKLLENSLNKIGEWLKQRESIEIEREVTFSTEERKLINLLVEKTHFTATMVNELESLLLYYKLNGKNLLEILDGYRGIEIKDKRESKRVLEEIRGIK